MIKSGTILFQRIIPSYRVPIFRYLYQQFGIIVCHSNEGKLGKIKADLTSIDFPTEHIGRLYYQNDETAVIQNVFTPLFKYHPKIVITQFSVKYLTFWLLFLLKPIFRYKLIIWTHGVKSSEINKPFRGARGKMSLFVFKNVDGILLYTHGIKKVFDTRLKLKTPIFVAQNTLDTKASQLLFLEFTRKGKERIKEEINFTTKYNLLFIGRLLKDKRIDLLLDSFLLIEKKFDVALYIIGEGEEITLINEYKKKYKNIFALGAMFDDTITGKYLYASDIMLIPGYVGLSIIHTFSFGTPIVTCHSDIDGPFHAPEIEYLIDEKNGLFCSLTASDIAHKIESLLFDTDRLKKMSECALMTAYEDCTIDKMCNGFKEIIESL